MANKTWRVERAIAIKEPEKTAVVRVVSEPRQGCRPLNGVLKLVSGY